MLLSCTIPVRFQQAHPPGLRKFRLRRATPCASRKHCRISMLRLRPPRSPPSSGTPPSSLATTTRSSGPVETLPSRRSAINTARRWAGRQRGNCGSAGRSTTSHSDTRASCARPAGSELASQPVARSGRNKRLPLAARPLTAHVCVRVVFLAAARLTGQLQSGLSKTADCRWRLPKLSSRHSPLPDESKVDEPCALLTRTKQPPMYHTPVRQHGSQQVSCGPSREMLRTVCTRTQTELVTQPAARSAQTQRAVRASHSRRAVNAARKVRPAPVVLATGLVRAAQRRRVSQLGLRRAAG